MDEFTSLLIADDTRVVVDLLKLSVCSRAGDRGRDVLSAVLSGMGTAYPQVSDGKALYVGPAFSAKTTVLYTCSHPGLLHGQRIRSSPLRQNVSQFSS